MFEFQLCKDKFSLKWLLLEIQLIFINSNELMELVNNP